MSVAWYLDKALGEVRKAMEHLAESLPPDRQAVTAFHLYDQFRPKVPAGAMGWGAKRELDVDQIVSQAR